VLSGAAVVERRGERRVRDPRREWPAVDRNVDVEEGDCRCHRVSAPGPLHGEVWRAGGSNAATVLVGAIASETLLVGP